MYVWLLFVYSRLSTSYNVLTAEPPTPLGPLSNTVYASAEQTETFFFNIMQASWQMKTFSPKLFKTSTFEK